MSSTAPRRDRIAAAAVGLLLLAACDAPLETGYVPRSLDSTEADRRSYYAPPFSTSPKPEGQGTGFNFGH